MCGLRYFAFFLGACASVQSEPASFLSASFLHRRLSGDQECGTRKYEVDEMQTNYADGESIPTVPIKVGTSGNIQADLPFDFTGVWWMKDNPVPEELLSFAGMTCSNIEDAQDHCSLPLRCSVPNNLKHMWSWDDSIAASVIRGYYAFTAGSNSEMVINFCNNTYGDIETGLTDVPLIWVDKWPIKQLNENQWLRPTVFQDKSALPDTDYVLTRILTEDGSATEFFDEFVSWMQERNRKLVVFDSDSDCKRRCIMNWWSSCRLCNWWCSE